MGTSWPEIPSWVANPGLTGQKWGSGWAAGWPRATWFRQTWAALGLGPWPTLSSPTQLCHVKMGVRPCLDEGRRPRSQGQACCHRSRHRNQCGSYTQGHTCACVNLSPALSPGAPLLCLQGGRRSPLPVERPLRAPPRLPEQESAGL